MSKFEGLALPVDEITSRMTIHHPVTQEPLTDADKKEAYIELRSPDSETGEKFERSVRNRRLQRSARAVVPTAEIIEKDNVGRLAALVVDWHLVGMDGQAIDVECNLANARELFGSRGMAWLTRQVDAHLANDANFVQASSKS